MQYVRTVHQATHSPNKKRLRISLLAQLAQLAMQMVVPILSKEQRVSFGRVHRKWMGLAVSMLT